MATTATEAWDALTVRAREIAEDSARDSFFLGFGEGWHAQENRPFHCAYCGYECRGDTDAATIELARAHAGACEEHPLAIEIRRLRSHLAQIESMAARHEESAEWKASAAIPAILGRARRALRGEPD